MNIQQNIIVVIEKKTIEMFGHLKRMRRDRILKMILQWNSRTGQYSGSLGKSGWIEQKHDQQRYTEKYAMGRELWQRKISLG